MRHFPEKFAVRFYAWLHEMAFAEMCSRSSTRFQKRALQGVEMVVATAAGVGGTYGEITPNTLHHA
jgi:hypothetical protein